MRKVTTWPWFGLANHLTLIPCFITYTKWVQSEKCKFKACLPYTPTVAEWSSYPPGFVFGPKMVYFSSSLFARLEIWGPKSNTFAPNFHHQEVFRHRNFGGHFAIVVLSYSKSHTYNYFVNGQWALTSPKLGTRTIILGRRGYLDTTIFGHNGEHPSVSKTR